MVADWHPSMRFEVLTLCLFRGVTPLPWCYFCKPLRPPHHRQGQGQHWHPCSQPHGTLRQRVQDLDPPSAFSTARDSSPKSTRLRSSMATAPEKQMTLSPSKFSGIMQSRLLQLLPSLQASIDTAWPRPTMTHRHTHSWVRCRTLVQPTLPPKNPYD
jgi:hypothetical protein